jgi:nitronate monooxygenase
MTTNSLTEILPINFPVIMAPMFLVSNKAMCVAAMDSGIAASFPSLNYRNKGELEQLLDELNAHKNNIEKGTYGVNLIVQETNPLYKQHLEICIDKKVPFFITSLGNPKTVIERAHAYGAKVFCDVTNLKHAKKCAELGCDGFIAVTQGAGGHAGPNPIHLLVPSLKRNFPEIPVIAAGGIASGAGLLSAMSLGAIGASIGTRFIACTEASVSDEYKNAIVESGMEDVVLSERLSGTPCNIINTPYAKKIGYKQNAFERWLNKNKTLKKYFKTIVQLRGMKKLQDSVKPGNYNNLWSAGQSVELIDEVLPIQSIVERFKTEFSEELTRLDHLKTLMGSPQIKH